MNGFAALVKAGRTYDIEDPRTTHRMHKTLQVLASLGIEPTITHGTRTYYDWAMRGSLNAEKHWCSLNGSGFNDCHISWPEWATDDIFDKAWELASLSISEFGTYNRTRAYDSRFGRGSSAAIDAAAKTLGTR